LTCLLSLCSSASPKFHPLCIL